ncbi:MAG TPA: hypothetical protein DIU07_22145 [Rhodobacteraceae bacterium]|nr:hypothetical protein [Paracoccaceae bacterium]
MDDISTPRHDRIAFLTAQDRLPALAEIAVAVAVMVTRWTLRDRTRKALKHLDPHQLDDIGKTPQEAWREAALPFWRD